MSAIVSSLGLAFRSGIKYDDEFFDDLQQGIRSGRFNCLSNVASEKEKSDNYLLFDKESRAKVKAQALKSIDSNLRSLRSVQAKLLKERAMIHDQLDEAHGRKKADSVVASVIESADEIKQHDSLIAVDDSLIDDVIERSASEGQDVVIAAYVYKPCDRILQANVNSNDYE